MNGRLARIDLRDFKTKQILGPLPNVSGNHASSFVTPNSEYTFMASRFSIPIPKGSVAGIDKYATEYKGVIAAVKIDPKTGEMTPSYQILMPPFDYDLGDAGKKISDGCALLHLLQHRAGDREARGDGVAAGSRLHRGHRLEGGGEGGRGGARGT